MGLVDFCQSCLLKIAQRSLTHTTSYIDRLFLIASLLFFFVSFSIFLSIADAAPSSSEEKKVQNPNVSFENGLLSVQAEGVKLKGLMEAISQKTGLLARYNSKRGGQGFGKTRN